MLTNRDGDVRIRAARVDAHAVNDWDHAGTLLDHRQRMRTVLACLVLLAACSASENLPIHSDPDAAYETINCDEQNFFFVAPKAGLTYSPNMIVIANMTPFYADHLPGIVAVAENDSWAEPIAAPARTTTDSFLVELSWSLSLEAGHRYTLYFSATECERKLDFFTAPQ